VTGGREQDLGGRGLVRGRGLEHVDGGSVVAVERRGGDLAVIGHRDRAQLSP
jgi:hypothetical protein